jgi:hypothetical protein
MTKAEELEEGVVYYVTTDDKPNREWLMKHKVNGFVDLEDKTTRVFNFTYYKADTYTKATPAQIKHYEACMKAGKYVEVLEVGKWYQWYHSNHKNTHIGKCLSIDKDNVNMSPWIVGRTTYNKEGSFNPSFIEEIIKLPESEVQQYLPKEAEEWGEGTYVVIIDDYHSVDIGDVHKIGFNIFKDCIDIEESVGKTCFPNKDCCKWFATKQEAEEFAKTLKEPIVYEHPTETQQYIVGYDPATGKSMVISNPNYKSERYIKTMEFFNQLREPEKSQAIANYTENYDNVIPDDLGTSLKSGFGWKSSIEGYRYWENICGNIEDNTYFNKQEAVHCPTQEEFDYVTEKLGYELISSNPFDKYPTDGCVKIGHQCYGRKDDFKTYTILTFQEWCAKYNHEGLKPWVAKVGDWVMIHEKELPIHSNWLGEGGRMSHQGPYIVTSIGAYNEVTKLDDISVLLTQDRFRKATQAEIDSVTKPATITNSHKDVLTLAEMGVGSAARLTEWTHDNWYVEVSSQEEADMVINAAAKMYGKKLKSLCKYSENWKYVSWHNHGYFGPLNTKNLSKLANPRPISDFITVSDSSIFPIETMKAYLRRLDKPYQQYPLTPSESFKVKSNPKLLDNNVSKISSINISLKQKSKSKKL